MTGGPRGSGQAERAVVVAVVAVRMVQVASDEVIDMIAVRHRLVAAAGAMRVARLMAGAAVGSRAAVGVGLGDLDHVLVDMIAVGMVQVPVMQMVHMALMAHGGVTAAGPMLVRVIGVLLSAAGVGHERGDLGSTATSG